ncbi:hypothetical protein, partial [Salinisphaera sp. S4-8]|uniref:hypothetical protein n=1 Tax=Salinisphaera sp. S4-8 TaxID=633357 RepID=UPI00333F23AC
MQFGFDRGGHRGTPLWRWLAGLGGRVFAWRTLPARRRLLYSGLRRRRLYGRLGLLRLGLLRLGLLRFSLLRFSLLRFSLLRFSL